MDNMDNNVEILPPKKITKPCFVPSAEERKLVEKFSSVGIPQESIALLVRDGISPKTLRKHFRQELDTASTLANVQVANKLYQKCLDGDTTALIWWTKTRLGWSEKTLLQHSGKIETINLEFVTPHNEG